MDKFLVKYDFQTLIDEDNLDEITASNDRLVFDAIDSAVEKAAGYIRHRYDFDQVFKKVQAYSLTGTYAVGNRVFWSPTAYDSASTYLTGDIVSTGGYIYQANEDIGTPEAFTPAKWTQLAENNTFYICIQITTAGILPTNTSYFTAGDNRNPLVKDIVVDITLYNIHSKISPRSIPDVRRTRYDGFGNLKEGDSAISTLREIQKGTITLDLPVISPTVQNTERIAYGTQETTDYNY